MVHIENLSLKEVSGRLAEYILLMRKEQKNDKIIQLNISKGQLANLLGTIPKTLSRMFSKMNDKKLISVEKNSIKILN